MIHVDGIGKGYGGQELFRDLSWHITRGQRIGLVGPNAAGKTTLCRILAGLEEPDAGRVHRPRGCTVGYLPQEVASEGTGTVLGDVLSGFDEVRRLEEAMAELAARLAAAEPEDAAAADLTARYGDLQHRYEALGGYRLEAEAKAILSGLGFRAEDFHRPLATFSGGWRARTALARLLLRRPDLLLLDEPTNHLDLESLAWLEAFLRTVEGTVVLVSHDRYFLNRMVDVVAEIDRGAFTLYPGNYDDFLDQKAARQEALEAARRQEEKRVAEIERFIERFRYKATKARQVQSRIKMLAKMDRVVIRRRPRRIRFAFPQPPRSGAAVCTMRNLHKAYGPNVVYAGIDFAVGRGDRIALVGVNGAGKSTLLKILAGVLPFEAGERVLGQHVSVHYYAQHQLDALTLDRTVLEELAAAAPDAVVPHLRTILGAFLFSGDDVEKRVSVLSGGEKARLALAKMLLRPANFLCLDEPTNHLDLAAREVLEEALDQFTGTIVFISHDRYFINRLANRVVEVAGGRLRMFPGNYDDYQEKVRQELATRVPPPPPAPPMDEEAAPGGAAARKTRAGRRREAEERQRLREALRPIRERLTQVEVQIQGLEARLAELTERLADPTLYRQGERVRETAREKKAIEEQIAWLLREWEDLSLQVESLSTR